MSWHGISRLVIVLQLLVEGLVDGLVLQVDDPAGLQPVKDLSRVLAHPEELLVDVGEVVAVLLGEDEALLGDPPRVGQVAPVGGVRVEPHRVGGRGQPPGDLCDDGDPILKCLFSPRGESRMTKYFENVSSSEQALERVSIAESEDAISFSHDGRGKGLAQNHTD